MTLITLENGQSLNPAHVVSYVTYKNGNALFNLTDGTQIIGGAPENFEFNFFPIIPAAPGFYEIFADVQEDLTRHWYQRAVIGWQITPGGNYPIIEGRIDGKDSVGQMYPDMRCRDYEGNRYESLEGLKAAIAEEDLDFLAKAYPTEKAA